MVIMLFDENGNKIQPRAAATSSIRKSGKTNPLAIIEKITKQFKDRSRKDIQKWRTALQVAESPDKPRRDMLMDIYDDLMTDGHLSSQLEIRKAATLNTSFQVISKKTGEVDPEKTQFFNKKWFYDFLENCLDVKFYGHSLIEFLSFDGDKIQITLIPRRNVIATTQEVVLDWSKSDNRINYMDVSYDGWVLPVGKDNDLGVLNKIVPNLIWKRNIMQSWAEFCERFGIPLITGTTLKQDAPTLDLIDSMLTQLGEASHAVFPEGTTVEIKEANRTDAYMVFDKYIERNNEEISKAITGGTMLSDNGSSKSQSEVHERNLEERIAPSDRRNIVFIINDELIPLLMKRGYSFSEDDFFTFDLSQELTLDKHWTIVEGIMNKYEVDQVWLSKRFNVPIVGQKEVQSTLKVAASATQKKKPNSIMNISSSIKLPDYPNASCCDKHDLFVVNATYNDEMAELHNKFFEQVWDGKNTLSQEAGIWALEASRLLAGLRDGWGERAITAAWNEPDHLMLQMMEYNLFEFTNSKTEARLAALSQLLIDKDKMGIKSFNDFKAAAEKVTTNFNTNWLKTEYNLSVAVGQNSAAFARAFADQDIIPNVQYITAGDNNVRTVHALLDKKIFSLKDPEALRLWPPNDYGCRCEMTQYPHSVGKEQRTSGKEATKLLGDGWSNSQFGINRGDLKQIFTNKQLYHSIKGMPEKLNSMNYKDTFGLHPYSSIKKGLRPLPLDKSITPDNVKELFRIDGKQGNKAFMGFEDYLKRKIILKDDVFNTHTSDNKYTNNNELRHQLFPHIKSILSNPNEVWLHEYKKGIFQSRYIKFFGDKAIIVDTNLNNNLEITSWHMMKADEIQKRKGLLIKQKE